MKRPRKVNLKNRHSVLRDQKEKDEHIPLTMLPQVHLFTPGSQSQTILDHRNTRSQARNLVSVSLIGMVSLSHGHC